MDIYKICISRLSLRHKWKRHLLLNKSMSTQLTDKRYILIGNYFYIHVSHLLNFNTKNIMPFYTKYFFQHKNENILL